MSRKGSKKNNTFRNADYVRGEETRVGHVQVLLVSRPEMLKVSLYFNVGLANYLARY